MARVPFAEFLHTPFDVIVVGGGINGAGIAREMALRGYSVALFDKGDFGGGTSSASSKLVHGGLRYLEHGDLRLVWEACRERFFLVKNASHLVTPIPFVVPVYRTSLRPAWMVRFGVWLYDKLAGTRRLGDSRWVNSDEAVRLAPGIRTDGLLGACVYWDAQMDDARLCLEVVLQAQSFGAKVLNYAAVLGYEKKGDVIEGVRVRDGVTGETGIVRGSYIVNAVGPWDEGGRLQLSKGVHLITRKLVSDSAVLVMTESDKRVFFVLPWGGATLIGTTDTAYHGRADDVSVLPEDVAYLLRETNAAFPEAGLTESDVMGSFAGLRPLLKESGVGVGAMSREHAVFWDGANLVSVVGGKYTTFRAVAEDVAERLCRKLSPEKTFHSMTQDLILYGGGAVDWERLRLFGFSDEICAHIVKRYGSAVEDVLLVLSEKPEYLEWLVKGQCLRGERVYAERYEFVVCDEDFMRRRTGLTFFHKHI